MLNKLKSLIKVKVFRANTMLKLPIIQPSNDSKNLYLNLNRANIKPINDPISENQSQAMGKYILEPKKPIASPNRV